MIIKPCAWVALALAIFSIVIGPFLIGEEREPYSAPHYLLSLCGACLTILLAGHALGWW